MERRSCLPYEKVNNCLLTQKTFFKEKEVRKIPGRNFQFYPSQIKNKKNPHSFESKSPVDCVPPRIPDDLKI